MASLTRGVAEKARSAWRFFIDTIDWTSNGDRRRPKFSERSDIYDPSAGWSRPTGRPRGAGRRARGAAGLRPAVSTPGHRRGAWSAAVAPGSLSSARVASKSTFPGIASADAGRRGVARRLSRHGTWRCRQVSASCAASPGSARRVPGIAACGATAGGPSRISGQRAPVPGIAACGATAGAPQLPGSQSVAPRRESPDAGVSIADQSPGQRRPPVAPYHSRPWTTTPWHRSAGTRNPSSSASATQPPPGPPSSASARRPGEPAWTGCTTRRWSAPWAGPPATPTCGACTSGRRTRPAPPPRGRGPSRRSSTSSPPASPPTR